MEKVFNPLDHIPQPEPSMVSTSCSGQPFSNDVLGVCPKCGRTFESAVIKKIQIPVYWCPACRVSAPMKDA